MRQLGRLLALLGLALWLASISLRPRRAQKLPPPPPAPLSSPPPPPPPSPTSSSLLQHVVFAADEAHFHGVAAAILSIRAHSASPASLRFHLVTQPAHTEIAAAAIKCYGASATVIALPEAWLAGRVRVEASANITGNLASPCNFARFFLPKLLPGVRRVLYLDADVVVQADVASLFELAMRLAPLSNRRWRSSKG